MALKATKSTKSMKSIQSSKSVSGKDREEDEEPEEDALVFETILPDACVKFLCPAPVVVRKVYQRDDYKSLNQTNNTKSRRMTMATPLSMGDVLRPEKNADDITSAIETVVEEGTILVTTVYDYLERLVEIRIHKTPPIPILMMKIITLLVPYYPELVKFSIRSAIDMYTIYELHMMLSLTSITEICLDDSPLLEANYAILLNNQTNLNNLSLCRCRINDAACMLITDKLKYSAPAEKNLLILNLSSNHITDVGAKSIAEALRSNRHLRYLNLSDNRITDDGADHIWQVLTEFPLTSNEIVQKKQTYFDYLKARRNIYLQYLNEQVSKSIDEHSQQANGKSFGKKIIVAGTNTFMKNRNGGSQGKTKSSKSKDTDHLDEAYLQARAEYITLELIGNFNHPFASNFIVVNNEHPYCKGNMVLCYLNLSYNNLSYLSIKKLLGVLLYQNSTKRPNQSGLLKVFIEGNNLPTSCNEYDAINDLLNRNITKGRPTDAYGGRRKSRVTKLN